MFILFFFLINKLSKAQKNIEKHEKELSSIAGLVGRFSGKTSATRKESMIYRSGCANINLNISIAREIIKDLLDSR